MDLNHAKTIPISNILNKLNITPEKVNDGKALYNSPLQNDAEPSLWVYHRVNRWYDFKISRGGDSIDFASAYLKFSCENHTVVDAVRWLSNLSDNMFSQENLPQEALLPGTDDPALILRCVKPIQFKGLEKFLTDCGIPISLARKYMSEARVFNKNTGKTFYALAVQNENGGYELSNPFFNGCIRPRTITFIRGLKPTPQGIHIFKDAIDFLSVLSEVEYRAWEHDTILLNHLSCAQLAVPYIRNYSYKTIYTWMDNTPTGVDAAKLLSQGLQNENALIHLQMNKVFQGFDDVNSWHVHNLKTNSRGQNAKKA